MKKNHNPDPVANYACASKQLEKATPLCGGRALIHKATRAHPKEKWRARVWNHSSVRIITDTQQGRSTHLFLPSCV